MSSYFHSLHLDSMMLSMIAIANAVTPMNWRVGDISSTRKLDGTDIAIKRNKKWTKATIIRIQLITNPALNSTFTSILCKILSKS